MKTNIFLIYEKTISNAESEKTAINYLESLQKVELRAKLVKYN